ELGQGRGFRGVLSRSPARAAAGSDQRAIRASGPLIEWLADRYALPFELVDNFNYPGHSAFRMHGLPSRTGRELIDRLRQAAEAKIGRSAWRGRGARQE